MAAYAHGAAWGVCPHFHAVRDKLHGGLDAWRRAAGDNVGGGHLSGVAFRLRSATGGAAGGAANRPVRGPAPGVATIRDDRRGGAEAPGRGGPAGRGGRARSGRFTSHRSWRAVRAATARGRRSRWPESGLRPARK